MNTDKIRNFLLSEKSRILNSGKNGNNFNVSSDNLSDTLDQAAAEDATSLNLKLNIIAEYQLIKINEALGKIQSGTFGTCSVCEDPIEDKRLEIHPFVTQCILCQESSERKAAKYANKTPAEDT